MVPASCACRGARCRFSGSVPSATHVSPTEPSVAHVSSLVDVKNRWHLPAPATVRARGPLSHKNAPQLRVSCGAFALGGARWACEPGSVVDDHLSTNSVAAPSSAQPERGAGHTMALLFAFAPDGACQAAVLPRRWWSLTPPFQLFSQRLAAPAGVFFSAALSVGLPRLAVSQLPALWSPDFPHGARLLAGPAVVWPTSRMRL